MHDVVKGIKTLLKKNGFLAFEVHYLGNLFKELQYDMIYHEHQFYYSLHALRNFFKIHDMEIFDVNKIPIRAGSMMYFVQNMKTGTRKISPSVENLLEEEKSIGLDYVKTYVNFARKIERTRINLLSLLHKLKKDNKTIIGYGASGRGTIIMNYCNLGKDLLDYVIDDSPAKHGAYTPGTHHKIYSSNKLNKPDRPDYALLFAWPFYEEIKRKNVNYLKKGGKFIVPLPKVRII